MLNLRTSFRTEVGEWTYCPNVKQGCPDGHALRKAIPSKNVLKILGESDVKKVKETLTSIMAVRQKLCAQVAPYTFEYFILNLKIDEKNKNTQGSEYLPINSINACSIFRNHIFIICGFYVGETVIDCFKQEQFNHDLSDYGEGGDFLIHLPNDVLPKEKRFERYEDFFDWEFIMDNNKKRINNILRNYY